MVTINKLLVYSLAFVITFFVVLLMAVSIFATIYSVIVPAKITQSYTVFMSLDSGIDHNGYVRLDQQRQQFQLRETYRVHLSIEIANSMPNMEMFEICAELRNMYKTREYSCQTAMIEYQSKWIRLIKELMKSTLYIFGLARESTQVNVELFSDFKDNDKIHPVTDIQIRMKRVEFKYHSVRLHFTANLSGFVYALVYWPNLTAVVGICAISIFIWIWIAIIISGCKLLGRQLPTIVNIRGRRNIHG